MERTISTDRPVEQVFAYLEDFTHAVEWDAGTIACDRLSGDGGEGTQYRNVSRFMGRETTLTYVVQRHIAPTTYVIQGTNKTVTSTDTMTIATDSDGGTNLTYRAEFAFRGVARLLEPVLRIPLNRLGDNAERSLSRALRNLPATS